ncbi:MAG: D-alanyl-D-alanine carboxypeptidase family protein [Ruminococcus sp.]|jgi:D-alanyl-D-alanine carboxypeptidase (penicillin-binding protein 5/6)
MKKANMMMIRKKRRGKKKGVLWGMAVLLGILLALFIGGRVNAPSISQNPDVDLEHLYSPNAVLTEANSGRVIAVHNGDKRIYPASLTKIMTAILAVEHTEDLEQTVTLPEDIFPPLYEQGASMAGFQPGEEVRLKDLLYGILLPSGAECCLAFADRIAGSEGQFAVMMNEKARELGMKNTHFTNSTGLHDPDHYSTVKDISILLQYALKNDTFRTVFTTSRYSTQPSNLHPEGFTFYSTLSRSLDNPRVSGGEILGGKTGYTSEAGLCLASLARIHGKEYILVTAGADGTHETEPFHILDAVSVYNQI